MHDTNIPWLPVGGNAFEYGVPTRIFFEIGGAAKVGELCRRDGHTRALVVIDPFLVEAHVTEAFWAGLKSAGVTPTTYAEVKPNPVDTDIESAAALFRDGGHDVVIGVGGGSSLDTAKGVALLAASGDRIRDFDGNDKVRIPSAACICVPTTAGTGSEVTGNISVTNSDTQAKMAIRSEHCYPRYAVLDPLLLATLPQQVAANAGMDALVHAVESYTSTRATPLSRLIAYDAVRRTAHWLPRFVDNTSDPEAAAEMLYASCLAGMNLTNTGTGAAHAIARALGGHYGVAHGLACGVLIVPVMRFNASVAAGSYAELAGALGLPRPHPGGKGDTETTDAVTEKVAELRARIGLPATLPVRVEPARKSLIAAWAAANFGPNPRPGSAADVVRILDQVA